MKVLNRARRVRDDITWLSDNPRVKCESVVGEQFEDWDDDYLDYFRRVSGKLVKELKDGEGLCIQELSDEDLNGDGNFENSVAELENEGSDDDGLFVNSVSIKENENSEDDDPKYKIFLSHLKGNGKSFTFEIKDEDGVEKIFEYHKEVPMIGWPQLKIDGNVNQVAERKRSRSRSQKKVSKEVKRSCLRPVSVDKSSIPNHKHTSRNQIISRSKPNKEGLGKMGEEQREKSLNAGRRIIKKEQESLVEEDYRRFLRSAEIVDGRMNLPLESDEIIVYDEQVDLGNVLRHEVTSLRPSSSRKDNAGEEEEEEDDDDCQILEHFCETNQLKEKVMAILRKPFDGQEYRDLWHAVTQKNYILRHRDLKDNRELSVPMEIKAKSYLEQHEDLRRRMDSVPGNNYKKLNILRGFFFWLQHAAWGVSFKPWEDASCLAVMPGSH